MIYCFHPVRSVLHVGAIMCFMENAAKSVLCPCNFTSSVNSWVCYHYHSESIKGSKVSTFKVNNQLSSVRLCVLCRWFRRGEPGVRSGSGGESRFRPDGGWCGQTAETDPAGPVVRGGHAEATPEEVRVQPNSKITRTHSKNDILYDQIHCSKSQLLSVELFPRNPSISRISIDMSAFIQ